VSFQNEMFLQCARAFIARDKQTKKFVGEKPIEVGKKSLTRFARSDQLSFNVAVCDSPSIVKTRPRGAETGAFSDARKMTKPWRLPSL